MISGIASMTFSMPLLGDNRPNVRMTDLALKAEFCLGLIRFEKREIDNPVRDHFDFVLRDVVRRLQELTAFFRHDDNLGGGGNDPPHRAALCGRGLGQYGVQGGDDRHFQAREQIDDIATGVATENSIFMLKRYDIEVGAVQQIRSIRIVGKHVFADFEAHGRRIMIGAAGIGHRDHAGFEIEPGRRDRAMKIVGEGRNPAAAGQVIADERNTLERSHSKSPNA